MGFSVALLALAHVLAADSRCDTLPSCGTCLANSGCGWCASSTSCMSIASDGTVEGTCSDFQGSQCVGGSRDLNTRLSFRTLPSHQAVPIARLTAAVCLSRGPPQLLTAAHTPTHCGRRAMQLLHDLQLVRARALLHVQQCEWSMRVPVRAALRACITRHNTPQRSTTPPRPLTTYLGLRRPASGKQPAAQYTAYGASCGQ